MPDITMCGDYSCPDFDRCYRAQAEPNPYRQSYFMSSPRKMDGCDYLSPLTTDEELYANRSKTKIKPQNS